MLSSISAHQIRSHLSTMLTTPFIRQNSWRRQHFGMLWVSSGSAALVLSRHGDGTFHQRSPRLTSMSCNRRALGMKTLTEMLTEREAIAQLCETILDEGTEHWGVKVSAVNVEDFQIMTMWPMNGRVRPYKAFRMYPCWWGQRERQNKHKFGGDSRI